MNKLNVITENKKFKTGDLWGIFFEDLNHAADGGLYPEMIQNRSFEFSAVDNPEYTPLTAWSFSGDGEMSVEDADPINSKNEHYLKITCGSKAAVQNEGFNTGIYVKKGDTYNFSVYAKSPNVRTVTVAIKSADGRVYDSFDISIDGDWKKYERSFVSSADDFSSRLEISVSAPGEVYLDMVSLMPDKTFMGHGLREDLAKMLYDLKPKFMRFPGGCLTHDGSLNKDDRNSLYRWTNTIGPVEERPPRRNNWGYNQTAGLGFYEYFVLCEDIGAKPIPIVSGAWNPHAHEGAPIEALGEWIDEALALIEFANGDTSTVWGKKRAEMGHENPFGLEYIGVGNEEVAGGFFERYPYFHKAIREKYPDIKIIGTSGPWADGYDFDYGWNEARKHGTDIVDEHYYMHPEWFMTNIDRYASYDRKGPKVFLGEYASWGNTFENALTEACYMTELENNADVVALACYAPLFCNVDYKNWSPDMIWFDNHRAYRTVNYFVQQMFMVNQADSVVETSLITDVKNEPIPLDKISGSVGVSASKCSAEFYDISVNGKPQTDILEAFRGEWISDGGRVTQTVDDEIATYCVFKDKFDIIDFKLKAKKLGGREGFRIVFGFKNSKKYYFWEIGGWNNDVSSVCKMNGESSACVTLGKHITVEVGKEYDISIKAEGNHFVCTLDGEVIHDFEEPRGEIRPLYYTAGVNGDGTVIIKTANFKAEDYTVDIELDKSFDSAEITELKSDALTVQNSFEEPQRLIPSERSLTVSGNGFKYTFPAHSVTVIKLK